MICVWVISIIKWSTSTFTNNVGLTTHICFSIISSSSVSLSTTLPLKRKFFHPNACTTADRHPYWSQRLQLDMQPDHHHVKKTFDTRSWSLTGTIDSDTTIGLFWGWRIHIGLKTLLKVKDSPKEVREHNIFTKNFKVIDVCVFSLIKCSTSIFTSNVSLTTYACFSTKCTCKLSTITSLG